jgi:hypothetical protein
MATARAATLASWAPRRRSGTGRAVIASAAALHGTGCDLDDPRASVRVQDIPYLGNASTKQPRHRRLDRLWLVDPMW